MVALVLLPACFGGDVNQIEEDPGEARITIDVVGCQRDRVSGNVTLTFELTSEEEYQSVLVNGRVTDAAGTIVDTGTASLPEVQPRQTYRGEMVLAPAGDVQAELTCQADLEFAQDPVGG